MTLKVLILICSTGLFIIVVSLTMTWFNEKMLIYTRCIHDFMSNLIKKSKSRLSYRLVLLLPFIFPGWIIWVINFLKSWCVIPKDNKLDDFWCNAPVQGKAKKLSLMHMSIQGILNTRFINLLETCFYIVPKKLKIKNNKLKQISVQNALFESGYTCWPGKHCCC